MVTYLHRYCPYKKRGILIRNNYIRNLIQVATMILMTTKLMLGIQISQCSEIWNLLSDPRLMPKPRDLDTPTTSRSLSVQSLYIQP